MSKNNGKGGGMPNVASAPPADVMQPTNPMLQQRAPPPSYEESMRMQAGIGMGVGVGIGATALPPFYPGTAPVYYPGPYPTNYATSTHPVSAQFPTYPATVYQVNTTATSQQSNGGGHPVLELAKGAKIITTANGAVSIPPPPPGVAPTPAQIAAMKGQSVLVKTQKRGFF